MKKLIAITLLVVTGLMNMFPVCSISPVSAESAPIPQSASQKDAYGNLVYDGSYRYTYFGDEANGFFRLKVDPQGNIVAKDNLPDNPFGKQLSLPLDQEMKFFPSSMTSNSLNLSREWMMSLYGSGIGATGLIAQDLSGDGKMEIVAGANSSGGYGNEDFWYVLRQSGTNAYNQVWVSEKYASTIKRIAAADVNNDGIAEIFVGLADASVHVYRGSDFNNIATFAVKFDMQSLLLADADGNGSKEMIISNATNIAAYDPLNDQLLWECNGYGGDLAVGNVDADATPEIVLSTGYVLNGATRVEEWHYPASGGFGAQVEVGDIDGDGIEEIVGAASWYKITVFEADLRSPMWEIPTGLDIAVLVLADVNEDQRPEILYGDCQWGAIHSIDGKTHQELWQIHNPEHGVTGIAVGDVDQDQSLEVLWGAGYTSTGPDYLYVADILSGKTEWQSEDLDGPLSAVDVGDVDDDGQSEIVMASFSSNSGYADSVIKIFNAATHEIEWQITDIPNIYIWEGIQSIRIGDVDQDGETEFVIATANLYDGLIQIYNGRSHTLERQSKGYDGTSFTAMEIGDVDGDGQIEIVVGQLRQHTGATGVHVIVFNGATAEEEWQSIGLDTYWGDVYDIELKDVDGDSRVEIITSLEGSSVYVFDGVTHVMEALIPTQAYALSSADLDQNGTQSILVGRGDGKIDSYNGMTHALESTIPLGSGAITCLSLADINQNTVPEWLVCNLNRLSIYSTTGLGLLWQSGDLGASLGKYNQIPVGQIDQDNDLEILLGSMDALYQFGSPWSGPLGLSSMTVSPVKALPGDLLTYTVVLVNHGNESVQTVQVENLLPSVLSYVPNTLSASKGTAAYADGKITWNGDLNEQTSVMLSYQVIVNQDAPRAPLLNSAQITSGNTTWVISAKVTISWLYVYLPACIINSCGDYMDTFQDPSSGWLVSDDAQMKTEYLGGEYRILGKETGYAYLIKAPTCKHQNYTVEVDARWMGNSGSGYGLIFGLTDDFSKYYMLMVNTDYQDYSLYYQSPSGFEQIASGIHSSSILGGSASNHLKVTRSGSQIMLDINGSRQGTWADTKTSGLTNVGLVNAPYSNLANADARFDNFKVKLMPETASSLSDRSNRMPATTAAVSGLTHAVQPYQDWRLKHGN
jgi:uncharacterized repeat protein (TIGR01451 family)